MDRPCTVFCVYHIFLGPVKSDINTALISRYRLQADKRQECLRLLQVLNSFYLILWYAGHGSVLLTLITKRLNKSPRNGFISLAPFLKRLREHLICVIVVSRSIFHLSVSQIDCYRIVGISSKSSSQ